MPRHVFTPTEYAKFKAVDTLITSSLLPPDAALTSTLATNSAASLSAIDVNPNEGRFLYLLAKIAHAKRVLEIGTLGGYSAIWFAKAVGKEGKVVTLELEAEHAAIAQGNIERAGFKDVVEIQVGPALVTLEKMAEGEVEPFDVVFIDADKENNVGYLEYALRFAHVGTVVVVDNVVMQGIVLGGEGEQRGWDAKYAQGIRDALTFMGRERRLEATALQTVGPKGWDGFAVAVVVE